LESRRLRLILVAYLRGNLKPDYAQGVRSHLRKELILASISQDLSREAVELSTILRSGAIRSIKDNQRESFVAQTSEYIHLANQLREYYIEHKKSSHDLFKENEALVKLFDVLNRTGTLRKIVDAPKSKDDPIV